MASNEDMVREAIVLFRDAAVVRSYMERVRNEGASVMERYTEGGNGGFYPIMNSPEFAAALAADPELKHLNPADVMNLFGLMGRVRAVLAGEAVEAAPGSLGILYRTRIS